MTVVHFTSFDGTRIGCHREGSGPPLVLVHGTTADHSRWAPLVPLFGEHFTVYSMNRRGRGESGDADAYAIEREYEDVAAVVDGIGGPVHLLGHSFGGLCSLEASVRATNLAKLVLYEPPAGVDATLRDSDLPARLDALIDAGDRDGAVALFMTEGPRVPPAQLAMLRAQPAWRARVDAAHTIARELRTSRVYAFEPDRFRSMGTPTLLMLGGDSPPFFGEAIRKIGQALPASRTVVMAGQQHNAMDLARDLFVRHVMEFLRSS